MKSEILALAEWARLLFDARDMHSFCSIVAPILTCWIAPSTTSTAGGGTSNVNDSNTAAASTTAATAGPVLGRKIRNKDSHTVSMYQLALSQATTHHTTNSTTNSSSNTTSANTLNTDNILLPCLDSTQKTYYLLVTSMVNVVVRLEAILPKELLLSLAGQLKVALEALNLSSLGALFLHRCNLKSIEKLNYIGGRQRTSTVQYVEYNLQSDETPAATSSGKNTHSFMNSHDPHSRNSSSSPVIIAWNKFRRSKEDFFLSAAKKLSPSIGTLAKQLYETPDNIKLANTFYTELCSILLQQNTTTSGSMNNIMELQLPLSRLTIQAPKSTVAHIFAAQEHAVQRKHGHALSHYTAAFCFDSTQPLTALCAGNSFFSVYIIYYFI